MDSVDYIRLVLGLTMVIMGIFNTFLIIKWSALSSDYVIYTETGPVDGKYFKIILGVLALLFTMVFATFSFSILWFIVRDLFLSNVPPAIGGFTFKSYAHIVILVSMLLSVIIIIVAPFNCILAIIRKKKRQRSVVRLILGAFFKIILGVTILFGDFNFKQL